MSKRYITPSLDAVSFSCPHCGTLATQTWYAGRGNLLQKDRVPIRLPSDKSAALAFVAEKVENELSPEDIAWAENMAAGAPFLRPKAEHQYVRVIGNFDISECYACGQLAFWIGRTLTWPQAVVVDDANADLPAELRADYSEAASILEASPRGAAALLRLSIQKLCVVLGEPGKNINSDIGSLVAKGLDPRVQKMLDVVRVIGNDAVHPGTIDLRDDRSTAEKLFRLVNMIADVMISQPKHIDDMYSKLPPEKREQIERRDRSKE